MIATVLLIPAPGDVLRQIGWSPDRTTHEIHELLWPTTGAMRVAMRVPRDSTIRRITELVDRGHVVDVGGGRWRCA